MMTTETKLRRAVLRQCNDIRLALDIGHGKLARLPKGKPKSPHHCVVAKALSNGWSACVSVFEVSLSPPSPLTMKQMGVIENTLKELGLIGVRASRYSIWFNVTPEMRELMRRFDAYLLPTLILNRYL